MSTAHILRTLLPHDSVALGRFVKNANRPHQDYIDPLPPRPHPTEGHTGHHTNFSETRKFSKGSSLRLSLGNLIQLVYKGSNTSTATLTAPNTTTYDLSNSDNWFKDACKQEKTRRWLEEAIDKGQNMYLVVGFRTAQNASLASSFVAKNNSHVTGEVPMSSFGPPAPLNPLIFNPGGGGTQSCGSATNLTFDAPGEQVFAILYRKIKFSWLSSRNTANMKLEEGNRWKSVWDWRGPNDNIQDDEDDVLQAELTDSSDLDDEEEYVCGEEDDGFGDVEIALMPAQADTISGIGSSAQQSTGVLYENVAAGSADEVSKVLGVESEQKHSALGTSRMLLLWGIMLLLFLLLCQWFFELKLDATQVFSNE